MQDLKLAVLIDADNISPKYVKVILDEAASFGVAALQTYLRRLVCARLKRLEGCAAEQLHHSHPAV